MRILLTGASGLIGRSVLRQLQLDDSHEVISYGRSVPDQPSIWHVPGDFRDIAVLGGLLERVDAVVHCAGAKLKSMHKNPDFNERAASALIAAAKLIGRKRLLVNCGSIKGCELIARQSPYGGSKFKAEKMLLACDGFVTVSVRIPLVYSRRHLKWMHLLRSVGLLPRINDANLKFSCIEVTDLALYIERILHCDWRAGCVVGIPNCEEVTWNAFACPSTPGVSLNTLRLIGHALLRLFAPTMPAKAIRERLDDVFCREWPQEKLTSGPAFFPRFLVQRRAYVT